MKIRSSHFEAFLKCPSLCWLRFTGEIPTGNAYAEWVQSQNESYRTEAIKRWIAQLPAEEWTAAPAPAKLKTAAWRFATAIPASTTPGSCSNDKTPTNPAENDKSHAPAATMETCLPAVERIPSAGRGQPAQFVPIHFLYRNKLTKDDKLLLAFDAFVLSEMLGRAVSNGKIIHGDAGDYARSRRGKEAQPEKPESANLKSENNQSLLTSAATINEEDKPQTGIAATPDQARPRVTKVKTAALAGEVRKRLGKITALLTSSTPPDLVLNRHCAECEFQARCRKIAVEKDDLSLLANMSAKERQKLRSKGIFTVTQLSYTFRPRRRPKRQRDKREKYHHALKALAIREQKIHIVGSPELKIEGTPVYLDVEGLPDRDFYYLIGVRIGNGDSAVQHSLWADTIADEGEIWREFLSLLETVGKPVLIHYGSYETKFLKEMKERHGGPQDEPVAAKSISLAINLVSVQFAQIYFPTLTNGIKDIAACLGFKWSEIEPAGLKSIVWRNDWNNSRSAQLHEKLTTYNAEDCQALEILLCALKRLGASGSTNNPMERSCQASAVNVESIKRKMPWKEFTSAISEFKAINKAAQWDYQRDRVHVRGKNKRIRRRPGRPKNGEQNLDRVNKVVVYKGELRCPQCQETAIRQTVAKSRTLQDLRFGTGTLKRWIIEYRFYYCGCDKCKLRFGVPSDFRIVMKYGWNLIAFVVYEIIELRIPQTVIQKSLAKLFGFQVNLFAIARIKDRSADYYKNTQAKILGRIASGALVHVDETRANIKGKVGYVWVFTNLHEVAYIYSDSREGEIAHATLSGFNGVLVSDFYAAYDAFACPQQKCLIHLMRDLNDEMLDHPFDEELRRIAMGFADILKPMVETVDRYGLKRHFLKKHLLSVDRFYKQFAKADLQSAAATKCKERFEKNRDKLFTFLEHDGVPWNNNNAEHAIKAFAVLRDVIRGSATQKGLEDYLILLSVCQTCKYMGVDFLDFLRSGEKDIHAFAEGRRRKRPAANKPSTDSASKLSPDILPPRDGQST